MAITSQADIHERASWDEGEIRPVMFRMYYISCVIRLTLKQLHKGRDIMLNNSETNENCNKIYYQKLYARNSCSWSFCILLHYARLLMKNKKCVYGELAICIRMRKKSSWQAWNNLRKYIWIIKTSRMYKLMFQLICAFQTSRLELLFFKKNFHSPRDPIKR